MGVTGQLTVAADRVVTADGVLAPGWLTISGGRIAAVGEGEPGAPADLRGHWALPGFIDMHVHGGGGASFTEGGADEARRAAAFHRAHGSTRIIASLVTAPVDALEHRLRMLAGLAGDGVIDGIHLEGPFLAASRCGAQDPRYLIAPHVATFARLNAAAGGWLRMITIAPELPGATQLIRAAAATGVIAAAGHTDASAEVTAAAVDAGVSHATHLFNGMRPLGHRDPGPAGALLDRQVTCEVVADGTHLHDTVIRLAARAAGRDNLVLITDAMAAAGMPDGPYRLGSLDVLVTDGVARLASAEPGGAPGSIAGSTATMDAVVRHAITAAGLDVADVAAAAAANPARRLGLAAETGALRSGLAADLILLDDTFRLTTVIARGVEVPAP
ncbi:N-acetylglucosamine-6-phosphate deacetylase [Trebonia kvetii]|uniref:N-acetylglucosamine-6-phosphate deacetylase n=1 Tax=Trebonia kvetii TaxID=2480626 RepID=A0A6P2BVB7_9ACTN|nr:N-acetylglucosamine-6-phosphate deacetylase [Trebonia kvetii]TVZ03052.1 N-acetylglucosamine-6-phosphate deacetylase [Trebonia kvetii]